MDGELSSIDPKSPHPIYRGLSAVCSAPAKPDLSPWNGCMFPSETYDKAGAARTVGGSFFVDTSRDTRKRKASCLDGPAREVDSAGYLWTNGSESRHEFYAPKGTDLASSLVSQFHQIKYGVIKLIAIAWIRAICPKKQGAYSYANFERQESYHHKMPSFWSVLNAYRFVKPEGLRKQECVDLLVHLLGLFWTEKEWLRYNPAWDAPSHIQNGDWVGFLENAFPIEGISDVKSVNSSRAETCKTHLTEIYKIAKEQDPHKEADDCELKRSSTHTELWSGVGTDKRRIAGVDKDPALRDDPLPQEHWHDSTQNLVSSLNDVQTHGSNPKLNFVDMLPYTEEWDTSGSAFDVSDQVFDERCHQENLILKRLPGLEEAMIHKRDLTFIRSTTSRNEPYEDQLSGHPNERHSMHLRADDLSACTSGQVMQPSLAIDDRCLQSSSNFCHFGCCSQLGQNSNQSHLAPANEEVLAAGWHEASASQGQPTYTYGQDVHRWQTISADT